MLSFVYVAQCEYTSSQLSESAKKIPLKQSAVAKYSRSYNQSQNILRQPFFAKVFPSPPPFGQC